MSEAIDYLKSIDQSLKALLVIARSRQPKEIASDADLEGPYGDPEIKAKDPRDWSGPPMKGKFFSQCPPEYLDLLASRLDYFAEQAEANNETSPNTGKPIAPFRRRDAARARGWAKRLRNGYKPPVNEVDPFESPVAVTDIPWGVQGPHPAPMADDDSDIPF